MITREETKRELQRQDLVGTPLDAAVLASSRQTFRETIRRQALELAAADCVGSYTPLHLTAWRELAEEGLVENVSQREGMSRFYRITDAGRKYLREAKATFPEVTPD